MNTTEMMAQLRILYAEENQRMQKNFHRTLPLGELIIDRWEKARMLGFGEKSSIYESAVVFGDVYVGNQTWIGPQVVLDGAAAPVHIGSWCCISAAVHVYTHDSVLWCITGGKAKYVNAPVVIGDRVYIGPMSVISKGITIGDGCIIGANSFVNCDIPDGCAAWGSPARVVGLVEIYADGSGYHISPIDESYQSSDQI